MNNNDCKSQITNQFKSIQNSERRTHTSVVDTPTQNNILIFIVVSPTFDNTIIIFENCMAINLFECFFCAWVKSVNDGKLTHDRTTFRTQFNEYRK